MTNTAPRIPAAARPEKGVGRHYTLFSATFHLIANNLCPFHREKFPFSPPSCGSRFKQERFTAYQEVTTLAATQKPVRLQWEDRQIALREISHLSLSEDRPEPIRVVVSDETWVEAKRVAGKTVRTPRQSHWRWIATPELDPYPSQVIWRAGHQRWDIENHAFNELTKYYHLTHCPHHHPVAILAWLLILLLAFNLFEVFIRLHGKLWTPDGNVTLLSLALTLDRALEHPDELQPLWSG